MGHTLVARFEPNDFDSINGCLIEWKGKTMNKIPFGRNCDREEANRILPFHMTLLHWARSADSYMLQKMSELSFSPVTVIVTGLDVMYAEENSFILYFQVTPEKDFYKWECEQEKAINATFSGFLHITIAVSKDLEEINQLKQFLKQNLTFPIELRIGSLELYHIWRPVKLIQTFGDNCVRK